MSSLPLKPAQSRPAHGFKGEVSVPGDKSMSHRSLMFGTLAVGDTEIRGLLTGEDVMATAEAMRRLGAVIERDGDDFRVSGVGVGGLREPALPLDMGNSGTSTRLILGMLATHDLTAVVSGDASLNKRPMGRIADPLREMGAVIETAMQVMQDGAPQLLEFSVSNEMAWEVGLACGGTVEVFVERLA